MTEPDEIPAAGAPRRNSRSAVAAIVLLIVAGAFLAATIGAGGHGPRSARVYGFFRTPPLQVGDFALPAVNASGATSRFNFRAPHGSLLLVYFGYTYCPDVCPTTLSNVSAALGRLSPADRSRLRFAMVTVDPHRDTPRVFNTYLHHFLAAATTLRTTDWARLKSVEHAFDARSHIGPREAGGGYEVSHTAEIYAVDAGGTVREEWLFGVKPAELANDLHRLLAEQPAATQTPERTIQ